MSSQSFSIYIYIYIYMHKLLACCYFVVLLGIMRVTLQKSTKTCRSCIYLKFADDKMAG